jgi:hypothetical protein
VRRSSEAIDLEVVNPDGSTLEMPGAKADQTRRRHWPMALIVAVLTVVGLAVPGRTQLAGAEFRRLDRAWTEFTTDEAGHQAAIASVWDAALPPDQVLVNKAILNLDQEEAGRLRTVDHRLAEPVLFDGGLTRLRAAMRRVIGLRVAVLHEAELIRLTSQSGPVQAVETQPEAIPAIARVDLLLSSERGRFGMTRAAIGPLSRPYSSADGVLAAMTSDQRQARRAADTLALSRPRRSRYRALPA